MSTIKTRVILLEEKDNILTVLCEEGHSYKLTVKGQPMAMPIPIKINKKYICPGSDEVNKETKQGTILLPKWYANQRGIWQKG